MRGHNLLFPFVLVSLPAAVLLAPSIARGGSAWGDASLKGDDVRVEIDRAGRATISHTIGIHVAAKHFRSFTIEGVDDHLEPPTDDATAAGRDGPGWPIVATDAKGMAVEAFVEPTKEPRKLRVRLGKDGLPRGDYTLHLQYGVDLAREGAFTRDGAMLRFSWAAPRWPEGYDSAHVVFAFPAAKAEPKVSRAEASTEAGQPAIEAPEEGAIMTLRRGAYLDELELTRPHVPHADDARWILHVDPKAFPALGARLGAADARAPDSLATPPRGKRFWLTLSALSAAAWVLLALAMRRRDADAERAAAAVSLSMRAIVPWSSPQRSFAYGLLVAIAIAATAVCAYLPAAGALVMALFMVTLRPPRPAQHAARPGRWLAVPETGLCARARRSGVPFDCGTVLGACCALVAVAVVIAVCAWLSRKHLALSAAVAMHAIVLIPLFATGRASQLPPDLSGGAWKRLAKVARALARVEGVRCKIIARVARAATNDSVPTGRDAAPPTKRGIEEVRLRLEPDEDLRARGLLGIEVGCAIVHGMGTAALVPELLVRVDRSGCAARVFESRLSRARISATFLFTQGRSASEQVIAIRPAFTSPSNLRRWVRWVLVTARSEPLALVEHARAIPSVGVQRSARPPMTPGAAPLASA